LQVLADACKPLDDRARQTPSGQDAAPSR